MLLNAILLYALLGLPKVSSFPMEPFVAGSFDIVGPYCFHCCVEGPAKRNLTIVHRML